MKYLVFTEWYINASNKAFTQETINSINFSFTKNAFQSNVGSIKIASTDT